MIPRHPRKIDTASIEAILARQGIVIHRRSIQRDLEKLSSTFPISCDDRDKPFGWSWNADAPSFDIPAMSPPEALLFRMAKEFLSGILPSEIHAHLLPHFRHAEAVLRQTDKATLRDWPEKVRVVARTQPLKAPSIVPDVFSVVSDSLLEGRRFKASYRRRGEAAPVEWTIDPLGLVLQDRLLTLVCAIGGKRGPKDVRKLHLHRMMSAKPLDEKAVAPKGFSLDDFIAGGAFGYLEGEAKVRLKAVFEKDATLHLEETPLSDDQRLTPRPDGTVLVEATIPDTGQLRWWLLGFGGRIEVLKPKSLRDAMKAHVARMGERYGVKN